MAGYGTPVANPASILAALAFEPLFAALICLTANTVPTAFWATGGKMIPLQSIIVANAAAGLVGSEGKLSNQTLKYCTCYVALLGVFVYPGSRQDSEQPATCLRGPAR